LLTTQAVHPVGLEPPRGYLCHFATTPLKFDGRLDDGAWKNAPWTDEFVDIEGDAKPKPRFRTRVKMLWNDQFFIVGALLDEPHIWGTLTKHDSVIFQDNDFEIFIDPNGDNHEYYEIEINALNTEWDLFLKKPYRDGGPAENAWEIPGLQTGVHIDGTLNNPSDTDKFWSVEIAIPWKVLAEYAHKPAPPLEGDQWRVNFSRVEWVTDVVDGKYVKRKGLPEANWVWSPQGVIDMHRPERWGFVQFTKQDPTVARFKPDASWHAKDDLHRIYYAQRDFHKERKKWAESLEELSLKFSPSEKTPRPPTLRLSEQGFKAFIDVPREDGTIDRWTISEDSRVTLERP
jgi:hypothetical protein